MVIEGLGEDAGRLIRLELQNENLVALERGRVLASVPDLITVLDAETAEAIATERIRYGQRVTVIAFACAPVWRTEKGIAATGPRAFGYDFDYLPVERAGRCCDLTAAPSVRIRAKAAGALGGMDHQLSAGSANQRRPASAAT